MQCNPIYIQWQYRQIAGSAAAEFIFQSGTGRQRQRVAGERDIEAKNVCKRSKWQKTRSTTIHDHATLRCTCIIIMYIYIYKSHSAVTWTPDMGFLNHTARQLFLFVALFSLPSIKLPMIRFIRRGLAIKWVSDLRDSRLKLRKSRQKQNLNCRSRVSHYIYSRIECNQN